MITWQDLALTDAELQALIYNVSSQTHWPEEVFDSNVAGPSAFSDRHLPPPPDPELRPRLRDVWEAVFRRGRPPIQLRRPAFAPSPARLLNMQLQPQVRDVQQSTRNWSGAAVTPRDGNRITEVVGVYTVPVSKPPAGGGAPPGTRYRSAAFIGIDGQRRSFKASLPQIGTMHDVIDTVGAPSLDLYAWWWWWWPDQEPTPPTRLPNMPVAEGDVMVCWMTVLNPTLVRFLIMNWTQGVALLPWDYPAPIRRYNGQDLQVEVAGSAAEWIVERPTPKIGELDPYADFGPIPFTYCIATATRQPGQTGVDQGLSGATLMRTYEVRHKPPRTAIVARAERVSATEVAVKRRL